MVGVLLAGMVTTSGDRRAILLALGARLIV